MAKRRKLQHAQKPRHPAKPPSALKARQDKKQPQKPQQNQKQNQNQKQQQQQHRRPTIPFRRHDRILLIGEGDLSFAASIVKHHRCTNVTATVLEKTRDELLAKYPDAEANIAIIEGRPPAKSVGGGQVGDGTIGDEIADEIPEDTKLDDKSKDIEDNKDDDDDDDSINPGEDENFDLDQDDQNPQDTEDDDLFDLEDSDARPPNNRIVYGVDATKLRLPPAIARLQHDHLIFNFPHVGGKSTDVNRQVRHNQDLLVSFFARALSSSSSSSSSCLAPGGDIVVTLFDAEPYTLWNIRDLARHAGLQVRSSFRFQPAAYPGYRHARTLGVVTSRAGRRGGGWRGEDRPARSYVFVRKGDAEPQAPGRKRRRAGDDSDTDSD